MRYNGGKKRISTHIAEIINQCSPTSYWEPFCGMCWVGQRVKCGKRTFSDASMATVSVLHAVQSGFEFPVEITEEEYQGGKKLPETDPVHGFLKFGCSFGGKPWGGMARGEGRNYAKEARNSLKSMKPNLVGSSIVHGRYDELDVEADVIYCDPPYSGTTACGSGGSFDSSAFWKWVRMKSRTAKVFVSEYYAPNDFSCIFEAPVRGLRRSSGVNVEKLFILS